MSVEAVMIWNEPNNASHWDIELDQNWEQFAAMVKLAAQAIRAESPHVNIVLGGISPIDPGFITNLARQGVLDAVDTVAVHGFPLDWNHWQIDEWPDKLASIQALTTKPVWVTEVGASSFGAEEVQEFGLRRSAEILRGKAERVHWYSLFDLPRAWPATTRHREAEGSSYYRHFYMGLVREDGTPKRALRHFTDYTPELGLCQWLHFEDHRLVAAVQRDQHLVALSRHVADIDLLPARLVRDEGDPPSVGRRADVLLPERTRHQRLQRPTPRVANDGSVGA